MTTSFKLAQRVSAQGVGKPTRIGNNGKPTEGAKNHEYSGTKTVYRR